MTRFTTKRERRLWLLALIVQAAIYLTLGLAGRLLILLQEHNLVVVSFIGTLVLVGVAITLISVNDQRGIFRTGLMIGVSAVYWMASMRILAMEERSHLFEYSLVAALIFQALSERKKQRPNMPPPAVLAVGITTLLGLIDEAIQFFLPSRVFDLQDIAFNSLAALMAVTLSLVIRWLARRFKDSARFDAKP